MMDKDKVCLTRSAFDANLREYFMKLREGKQLFDVTLATDDGHLVQAHKAILSAEVYFSMMYS